MRLLLYVAFRRVVQRKLLAILCAVLLGTAGVAHVVGQQRYTLTVTNFDINPSTGTILAVYSGDRRVAQANVYDGSLIGAQTARFHLPPGTYTLYASAGMRDVSSTPSGTPRNVSIVVQLDSDRQIDLRRQLGVRSP